MTVDSFVARRRPGWSELEAAAATARRGALRDVSTRDLERIGVLYRRASSDLAVARRDFRDDPVTQYLNDLCARVHPLLFRGSPLRPSGLAGFFATGLPRAYRAAGPYVLAAAALMLAGVVAGWLAVQLRPDLAPTIVPDSLFDRLARGEAPGNVPGAPLLATFIISNNIKVALIALVFGVAAGLPTAFMLLANGWMLGTLGAAVHRGGYDLTFWSYIVPHGVIELSIIVIAGAAGLMLGDALLRPGLRRRVDALHDAALRAVVLGCGAALLLVIAGCLEGFVSPSGLPELLKYLVGAATAALLYGWLLCAGRQRVQPSRLRLDATRSPT